MVGQRIGRKGSKMIKVWYEGVLLRLSPVTVGIGGAYGVYADQYRRLWHVAKTTDDNKIRLEYKGIVS